MSEFSSEDEPASQEQLRQLKQQAVELAVRRGTYYQNSSHIDEYDGLPLSSGDIHYTFPVPLARIQQINPTAPEILGLGGDLQISGFPPQYQLENDEPKYLNGRAMFNIPKPPEHSLVEEVLIIDDDEEEGMKTDRLGWGKGAKKPNPKESAAIVENLVANIRLEQEMGLTTISKKEAAVLGEIVEALLR